MMSRIHEFVREKNAECVEEDMPQPSSTASEPSANHLAQVAAALKAPSDLTDAIAPAAAEGSRMPFKMGLKMDPVKAAVRQRLATPAGESGSSLPQAAEGTNSSVVADLEKQAAAESNSEVPENVDATEKKGVSTSEVPENVDATKKKGVLAKVAEASCSRSKS